MEIKTIEIEVFRDSQNRPTCCKDWVNAQCCQFLRTHMGVKWICGLTNEKVWGWDDYGDLNFLKPVKDCLLWKDTGEWILK